MFSSYTFFHYSHRSFRKNRPDKITLTIKYIPEKIVCLEFTRSWQEGITEQTQKSEHKRQRCYSKKKKKRKGRREKIMRDNIEEDGCREEKKQEEGIKKGTGGERWRKEVRLPSYSSGVRLLMLVTALTKYFIPDPRLCSGPRIRRICLTTSHSPSQVPSRRFCPRDSAGKMNSAKCASSARESWKSPRMIANHSPGRA